MDKLQAFKEITCSMMKENIALLKAWKKDVLYDTGDFTRIYNWIQELGKVPKKKSNIEGKYDDALYLLSLVALLPIVATLYVLCYKIMIEILAF